MYWSCTGLVFVMYLSLLFVYFSCIGHVLLINHLLFMYRSCIVPVLIAYTPRIGHVFVVY
jgi:hypothetical protein